MRQGDIESVAASLSNPSLTEPGCRNLVRAALDHADELLAFLRRQTRGGEEAHDLRQEVFLRLGRAADQAEIVNLRAYCFRVARNLLTDFHRRHVAETRLFEPGDVNEEAPCSRPTPEAQFSGQQDFERLRAAVDELPPHLRNALLWARIDGLKLAEIGSRLGVSESMAGRYVTRALNQCRAYVSRTGPQSR